MVAAIAIGVSTVAAVGGTIAQGAAASKQAKAQNANAAAENAYTNDVYDEKVKYQKQLESYEQDTWKTDLDFATKTLDYQEGEFTRQQTFVGDSAKNIIKNANAGFAQDMLANIQDGIATSLQESDVRQKVSTALGSAQTTADAQGVEGNSVDAILQNVQKQGGDAINVLEMNRSAANAQARIDIANTNATAGTQLSSLGSNIQTYSPATQVRAPAPLEPVVKGNDVASVSSPGVLGTVFGTVGDLAGGVAKAYAPGGPLAK